MERKSHKVNKRRSQTQEKDCGTDLTVGALGSAYSLKYSSSAHRMQICRPVNLRPPRPRRKRPRRVTSTRLFTSPSRCVSSRRASRDGRVKLALVRTCHRGRSILGLADMTTAVCACGVCSALLYSTLLCSAVRSSANVEHSFALLVLSSKHLAVADPTRRILLLTRLLAGVCSSLPASPWVCRSTSATSSAWRRRPRARGKDLTSGSKMWSYIPRDNKAPNRPCSCSCSRSCSLLSFALACRLRLGSGFRGQLVGGGGVL